MAEELKVILPPEQYLDENGTVWTADGWRNEALGIGETYGPGNPNVPDKVAFLREERRARLEAEAAAPNHQTADSSQPS